MQLNLIRGNHQPNPSGWQASLGCLGGFTSSSAPAPGHLLHLGFICGSLGIRGAEGAMPHVLVDVPAGLGSIPIRGTHGAADNLISLVFPAKALGSQGRWRDWGHRLWPWGGDSQEPSACPSQALCPGEALGCRFGWKVGERMWGNPIAPAVPEAGKVHIVRNLPGFSSCPGVGFHTPEKFLEVTGHSPRPRSCTVPEQRGSHPHGCTKLHQKSCKKAEFGVSLMVS